MQISHHKSVISTKAKQSKAEEKSSSARSWSLKAVSSTTKMEPGLAASIGEISRH